jgi:hypothetical protein
VAITLSSERSWLTPDYQVNGIRGTEWENTMESDFAISRLGEEPWGQYGGTSETRSESGLRRQTGEMAHYPPYLALVEPITLRFG